MTKKIPELPADMPVLPDSIVWFRGRQVDTAQDLTFTVGGEEITGRFPDVKDQYAAHLAEKDAEYQASNGFADTLAKSQAAAEANAAEAARAAREQAAAERAARLQERRQKVAQTAVEAVQSPVRRLAGHVGAMIAEHSLQRDLASFDRRNGSNVRTELAEARRQARIDGMRSKVGLIAIK
jgi:hypothetical protein